MRESLPVVAMYVPHLETLVVVTVDEACASTLTTGVEPIFGVHMRTSPLPCPVSITPFCRFYVRHVGIPRFVFASEITCPVESVPHSDWSGTTGLPGDMRTVTCDDGFSTSAASNSYDVTCLATGNWDTLMACNG